MLNRFDAEWRWFHRRNDSPWYPELRIFSQGAFGDWQGVLGAVQQALSALPGQRQQPKKVRAPRTGPLANAGMPLPAASGAPATAASAPHAADEDSC